MFFLKFFLFYNFIRHQTRVIICTHTGVPAYKTRCSLPSPPPTPPSHRPSVRRDGHATKGCTWLERRHSAEQPIGDLLPTEGSRAHTQWRSARRFATTCTDADRLARPTRTTAYVCWTEYTTEGTHGPDDLIGRFQSKFQLNNDDRTSSRDLVLSSVFRRFRTDNDASKVNRSGQRTIVTTTTHPSFRYSSIATDFVIRLRCGPVASNRYRSSTCAPPRADGHRAPLHAGIVSGAEHLRSHDSVLRPSENQTLYKV